MEGRFALRTKKAQAQGKRPIAGHVMSGSATYGIVLLKEGLTTEEGSQ